MAAALIALTNIHFARHTRACLAALCQQHVLCSTRNVQHGLAVVLIVSVLTPTQTSIVSFLRSVGAVLGIIAIHLRHCVFA